MDRIKQVFGAPQHETTPPTERKRVRLIVDHQRIRLQALDAQVKAISKTETRR